VSIRVRWRQNVQFLLTLSHRAVPRLRFVHIHQLRIVVLRLFAVGHRFVVSYATSYWGRFLLFVKMLHFLVGFQMLRDAHSHFKSCECVWSSWGKDVFRLISWSKNTGFKKAHRLYRNGCENVLRL